MKSEFLPVRIVTVLLATGLTGPTLQAQECKSKDELQSLPGKYTDAAHYEWPAARATWFNDLKTAANKATATKILTRIETLENNSRANFRLTGAVLKSSFHGDAPGFTGSKYATAAYDLNLGVYEYLCINNKITVNSEYANVFRAYVNRFKDLSFAFSNLDNSVFYLTADNYDGRYIALHDFFRFPNKKILDAMNAGIGLYQDIPESGVKQGSYSTYITRHWYIIKPGVPVLVPVTRKEYLEALLTYYDRELAMTRLAVATIEKDYQAAIKNARSNEQLKTNAKKAYDNHLVKYKDFPSKYEIRKNLVNTALKEHDANWLAQPAVVCPKPVTNWVYDKSLGWSDGGSGTADSEADGIRTGSFTFSGFWDDRGGDILYQYNPLYFKNNTTAPAKPQFIELAFRYVKTPLGQGLVENFTNNFDFKAVQQLLE